MIELNLTQNNNENLPGTKGKYYPRVEYKETYDIDKLAEHMRAHDCGFGKGIIIGVLSAASECIRHLVLDGNTVKLKNLGIIKASVEGNGLTLAQGAKISGSRGVQRKDEELAQDISLQQFAVSDVKIIMQATGETTIEAMNRDAKLGFTSKAKALVKQLTGNESNAPASPTPTNSSGDNSGGGSPLPVGGDTEIDPDDGD
jgi:hypothetical protein